MPANRSSIVRHALNPNPYTGIYGGSRSGLAKDIYMSGCPNPKNAGKMYAKDLQDTINFDTCGEIAGFWAEGIQGVSGTIQFAEGYIEEAFKIIRKNGGICVMDEVQTGFGRTGDTFWGWQDHLSEQDCPDIVVMAKSIGNGFPLAAVITTEEIANSISTRTHFNTYGGNPLACAVGNAVLDVIESENTQANCKKVGQILMDGFHVLQDKHDIIGDVRGKGLMLGIEFVKDRETKEPATKELNAIWEMMKAEGILAGKGGFFGNTLRLKPPMCMNADDAKFFLQVLDHCIVNAEY